MSRNSFAEDDGRTIAYFSELLSEHGLDPRSLDWGSRGSQELRFSVLADVAALEQRSVLDVGCGLGDFFAWIRDRGVPIRYTGIDITPGMVAAAKQRFPQESFLVENLLDGADGVNGTPSHDVVLASGLFYRRQVEPYQFFERMVEAMFERCRIAVAFNSLSSWSHGDDPAEFRADPLAAVSICKSLTPWVVLRHDYHPGDFSIYMYRGKRPA